MSNSNSKTGISPFEWGWTTIKKKYFSFGRVSCQPDAADFNLSVTLVAPWEEYVIDLSPAFKMEAEDALKHVIPNTAALEEKILDSLSMSAQANIAAGTPKRITVGSKGADQAKEEPREATEEAAPKGDKAKQGKDADDGTKAGHTLSKGSRASASDQAIGKDPMLEYAAATALFQEVKLLNRYVADAALRRDHRAYVVRLQISVVPFARHLPFDVYTNVSFFPEVESKAKGAKPQRHPALVIPLLVTDNLENAIKSRTVDTIRDLALTSSFLQPGVRGGARLGRKREDFKRALGADLNSLLTVGRVSDNTLQVRLGAVRDVTSASGYAMLPSTHNITVLLLVPSDFAKLSDDDQTDAWITAVAKTQLRDAETGTLLPHQSHDDRRRRVEWLLEADGLSADRPAIAEKLLRHVFANVVGEFEDELNKAKFTKPPRSMLDLWCEIVGTLSKSEFSAVRFQLPPPARLPDRQNVIAVDDGREMRICLQGGSGLNENGVTATLFVRTKTVQTEADNDDYGDYRVRIGAKETKIEAGGHGMRITFPSLVGWGIYDDLDRDGSLLKGGELRVSYAEGHKWCHTQTEDAVMEYPTIFYRKVKSIDPKGDDLQVRQPIKQAVKRTGAPKAAKAGRKRS